MSEPIKDLILFIRHPQFPAYLTLLVICAFLIPTFTPPIIKLLLPLVIGILMGIGCSHRETT